MNRPIDHPGQPGRKRDVPAAAARLLQDADEAMRQRQPERAIRDLQRVLELAPDTTVAWRMLGLAHHMGGRHADAAASLRRAVELDPGDAMIHMGLGIALHDVGEPGEALLEFERACELAPNSAACWFNFGKSLKLREHQADRACEALERALAIDPGHVPARLTLADAQTTLGMIDAAIANYREIVRRQPTHSRAWLALANVKRLPFTRDDTDRIRNALQRTAPDSEAAIELGFALARALEDQGDHGAAFSALATANAAKRRTVDWNAATENSYLHAIAQAFRQPVAPVADPQSGGEVIFVVSLPRSGSTLVEQILASHREVEGAGEILDLQQVLDGESRRRGEAFPQWIATASPSDWTRLGAEYLERTAGWRKDKPRFTDKNLLNWKLVGAALAMLPGARFVNIRREPLETCLACYRQLFRTGNGFSYALEDMAAYWKGYNRLCQHWQRLYPERFVDIEYESLVAQSDTQVRRLLDFCGLEFDPACLDFHKSRREVRTASAAQVRQPLRRDTARASHYGDALETLRSLLASKEAT